MPGVILLELGGKSSMTRCTAWAPVTDKARTIHECTRAMAKSECSESGILLILRYKVGSTKGCPHQLFQA